ncbi:N-acetylglucosaminyldiphosphoundecaprenol N-acetyl-beta-D-mannosaminyltransferase [Peribacillus deserti]|uniref:N-acetylglucosaminyldiphosphoundecaprenol N-acetyl-beta-D-mannosaminyltransferase n=1 Tax=Peribacillus deserti TaxID=673318 RepID=A0ABS2QCH0_9BACI|nr:WecB/TagA/CpsF family glycosyltransferase [Peribacillus deserti]MBM7690862.1 N-acetylglucosaminyldiphosphoundecaprenol N-acetyl-beta-D-mannosaminyltransferase [Peribacillus deserti]
MKQETVSILGLPFINGTRVKFVQGDLKSRIMNKEKVFIVTANPEIVEFAIADNEYRKMIEKADYIVPDGIGIIVASKMQRTPLQERITGFEVMKDLMELADKHHLNVYMLGAQEHVAARAAAQVKEEYPGLNLVGYHHGFFDLKDEAFAEDIAQLQPDLIFVATGAPRQEQWISMHYDKFAKGIFMGVGGCFDVLAGEVKGAPELWKRYHVEWLYRLLRQPSRWKRMLAIPRFLIRVAKNRS